MVLVCQKKKNTNYEIFKWRYHKGGTCKEYLGGGGGGGVGNSSSAQRACCMLNCAPHSILKIIAEITGNVGSEWGRAVSPDKPFSLGAAWPKCFSLLNLCASFSDLMRSRSEKENLSNKLNAYFDSFSNIRPIGWKITEQCWPERRCLHGTGELSRAGEPRHNRSWLLEGRMLVWVKNKAEVSYKHWDCLYC